MDEDDYQVEVVDEWELRQLFNDGEFWERVRDGELFELVAPDPGHPSPEHSGEPYCTKSLYIYYFEGGRKVAEVHQYERPDGSIGASGRPDPKALLIDGVLYVLTTHRSGGRLFYG